MASSLLRVCGVLLCLVLAGGCDSAAILLAGIGSGGTGAVASGPIGGFGSVIVNGVRFDDTAARVSIDGVADRPVTELRLGMVTEVRGEIDPGGKTGRAQEIMSGFALRGPVTVVTSTSIEVLGQQVRVGGETVLDGISTLGDLVPGDLVAVSGLHDATAPAIVATRIERRAASDAATVAVEGTVSALTPTTFQLGSLVVTYSAAQLVDLPAAGLADGMLVRVEAPAPQAGNALAAASVRALPSTLPAGAYVEYVGYVSQFASAASFQVGALSVNAANAQFVGAPPSTLANGVRVEVAGTVAGGVVNATEVEFLLLAPQPVAAEVEGPITDFLSPSNFRVRGQFVDATHAIFSGGAIGELANGRNVHVTGPVDGSMLAAASVAFLDTPPPELTRLAVDGTITDFSSPASFRVNGQPVTTGAGTTFVGGTAGDLANGRHVTAEGVVQGGVLVAGILTVFPAQAPQVVTTDGRVDNFVSAASFTVNGQPIAAGAATTYLSGTAASLTNGVHVTVTGTLSGGVLHATSIQFHSDDSEQSQAEVEGYISQFVSVSNFKVAGQVVDASGASFEGGRAGNLANGLKVHATGSIRGGVLYATRIEIDD